jgi:hypothetical protein
MFHFVSTTICDVCKGDCKVSDVIFRKIYRFVFGTLAGGHNMEVSKKRIYFAYVSTT